MLRTRFLKNRSLNLIVLFFFNPIKGDLFLNCVFVFFLFLNCFCILFFCVINFYIYFSFFSFLFFHLFISFSHLFFFSFFSWGILLYTCTSKVSCYLNMCIFLWGIFAIYMHIQGILLPKHTYIFFCEVWLPFELVLV